MESMIFDTVSIVAPALREAANILVLASRVHGALSGRGIDAPARSGRPVGKVVDFDWHRAGLDRDVEPDSDLVVRLNLPGFDCAGVYDLHVPASTTSISISSSRA